MMEIYLDEISESIPDEFEKYFRFIEHVASGSFGTVMKAINLENNKLIAVKAINKFGGKGTQKNINKLKQEITILKQLKHKNIVEFYGFVETSQKIYIMMEYIHNGTLKNLFEKRKEKNITEEEASRMLECLFSAVDYLHTRDICHRDIKPDNIMFENWNDMGTLKLVDFGLSAQYFEAMEQYEFCGTLIYMSPEQIESKIYTKSIDIWSCGIIMFMLLSNGIHPLYKKGDKYHDYVKKLKNPSICLHHKVSRMAKLLLMKLLEPDPFRRYSADKAINHPWITRKIDGSIPKTYLETMKANETRSKMIQVFGASIFLLNYKRWVYVNKQIYSKDKTLDNQTGDITDNSVLENKSDKMKKPNDSKSEIKEDMSTNERYKNFVFKSNLEKFKEYSERVGKYSEKIKKRFYKLREKCYDVCTTEEYDAFEKELMNSCEYSSKPRNSFKQEKKLSNGNINRYPLIEINNNNINGTNLKIHNQKDSTNKKTSLKLRRNTIERKSIEVTEYTTDNNNKNNYLTLNRAQNTTLLKKSIDGFLSPNSIINNLKSNESTVIRPILNEEELTKKFEKSLKKADLIDVKKSVLLNNNIQLGNLNSSNNKKSNNNQNFLPNQVIHKINIKSPDRDNNYLHKLFNNNIKEKEEIPNNSNYNMIINKSIGTDRKTIKNITNPISKDESKTILTLNKKINNINELNNLNNSITKTIKPNKSESILRKEKISENFTNKSIFNKMKNFSKEKVYIYQPKESESGNEEKKEKISLNIPNITNSIQNGIKNINFIKVLPLILPNLPITQNSPTNLNVFRNNKIQKRKSTKKKSSNDSKRFK